MIVFRLMLFLAALATVVGDAHAQLAGEWQQTALDRVETDSPKCISLWVSQRTLRLYPLGDGTFGGIYAVNDWAQWLEWQDVSCKLPYTAEAKQGYNRLRGWQVVAAHAGANRWKLGAQYQSCTFLGCNQPGLFMQSFEVTVELRGGRLVEVEGPGDHFSYRRKKDADAIAHEAESAFKAYVADFDAGNCVRFYGEDFMPGRMDTQQAAPLCQGYEAIRQSMPAVNSTNVFFKAPLDAVMVAGHYFEVDDALIYGFAYRADGTTQPRAAILNAGAGRWLIKQTLMM